MIIEDKNDEGKRLDLFLSERHQNISRSKIKSVFEKTGVFVCGKPQKASYKLRMGDEIKFDENEIFDEKIQPEDIQLDIQYEDDDILIINKPKGMLVHPAGNEKNGTLVNALLYRYGAKGLSDINGDLRPGILHRLDRNTSGLLIVAKNNETHSALEKQMKERKIIKKYKAIVKGKILEDGLIDKPIGRHKTQKHKMAICVDGKDSITKYKIIENFKGFTYIEAELLSGRTHQIRVHLASINHPVFGDSLYGGGGQKIKTCEQVLQSYYLSFQHPKLNETINIKIEENEELQRVLRYLRSLK